MLRLYTPEEAQKTILKRSFIGDMAAPESLLQSIERKFGERLTPEQLVDRILKQVRSHGDQALIDLSMTIDGFVPSSIRVPAEDLQVALNSLDPALVRALQSSIERVRLFHQQQPATSWMTNALGGTVGQWMRPIRRVGLYIPAGTAPLPSTVIMSAVPAQVAGVKEIVLVSPPERESQQVNAGILAAAQLLGITEVYAVGGAQAIAALAFGTQTITRVDKIFGPGNIFVTIAKQKVFGMVGIDNLAGPTETMIIADDSANPRWVAADLLAQAEHDAMASAILLSPSQSLIEKVQMEVTRQWQQRGRQSTISAALENRSGAVLTDDITQAIALANQYAPEHLCLAVENVWALSEQVDAAGGVFIGEHSFEVLGDYVAGPSHCMPTGGSARFSSPINVLDFVHFVSLVALDPATSREISRDASLIARYEGLDAHANAAEERL